MITTYLEAEAFLYGLPRSGKAIFGADAGFERAIQLFKVLGSPQDAVPAIHVAGTSGKGSVCYILSELLRAHGLSVGMYVSPHIYDLRERFTLNGTPIAKSELTKLVNQLSLVVEQMERDRLGRPSFFEGTTAIAFLANQADNVQYSVIETGLGGLYDTTNTISRNDKLAVITRLGLDHTEILGDTIAEIALQKAGIMPRKGVALVLRPDDPTARHGLEQIAQQRQTDLKYIATGEGVSAVKAEADRITFDYEYEGLILQGLTLKLAGQYQVENTVLALRALLYLAKRDNFNIEPEAIRGALASVKIPGRYEQRTWHGHKVILDGAHNAQKMAALCDALDLGLTQKPVVIAAFKEDKELAPLLQRLHKSAADIIITHFDVGPAVVAASSDRILETAKELGITDLQTAETPIEALRFAEKLLREDQALVVTGSMYVLGAVAELL